MSMAQKQSNYAFIDGINLHLTYEYLDWKMDYRKLCIYLRKRHNITTAYYFLGFIERNKRIYEDLKAYGYELMFRDVSEFPTEPIICPHCAGVVKPEGIKNARKKAGIGNGPEYSKPVCRSAGH